MENPADYAAELFGGRKSNNSNSKKDKGPLDFVPLMSMPDTSINVMNPTARFSQTQKHTKTKKGKSHKVQRTDTFSEFDKTISGISGAIKNVRLIHERRSSGLPDNAEKTIEKAKRLKELEKKGEELEKAKETIRDYKQRKTEYEAAHPKQSLASKISNALKKRKQQAAAGAAATGAVNP